MVFVNYRSADDAYAAAYLDHLLSEEFGPSSVFRAGRSISPGSDYEDSIMAAASSCDAMLALVGPRWVDSFQDDRHAVDWVRLEIETALKKQILVVPVLLSGVTRLSAQNDLPAELAALARLQYVRFTYRNAVGDFRILADALGKAVPTLTTKPGNPGPTP